MDLCLTGRMMDAAEAERAGLVSRIVPAAEVLSEAVKVAERIAQMSRPIAMMIKESVNQTVDNMGFYNGLQACFTLHQLNHSHWAEIHENKMPAALPEDGVTNWREAGPVVPAVKHLAKSQTPAR